MTTMMIEYISEDFNRAFVNVDLIVGLQSSGHTPETTYIMLQNGGLVSHTPIDVLRTRIEQAKQKTLEVMVETRVNTATEDLARQIIEAVNKAVRKEGRSS